MSCSRNDCREASLRCSFFVVKRRAHQSGLYARLQTADRILFSGWLPASIFGAWIPSPAANITGEHRCFIFKRLITRNKERLTAAWWNTPISCKLIKRGEKNRILISAAHQRTFFQSASTDKNCCRNGREPQRISERDGATHTWTRRFMRL